jgi:FMN-dependent NADH-azoreductase
MITPAATSVRCWFIGITDLDIVLAGSARAGMAGETAVEEFGEVFALAAAA